MTKRYKRAQSEESDSNTESTKPKEQKKYCRFIPAWFFTELVKVIKLAWPMIVTTELAYGLSTISLIFAGTLGTTEQGGIALANSLLNVACQSIASGVTTACDTFFSQTFGSGNKKMVGVHVQRSVMIISLLCFPVWSLLINAEQLLLLLGQDPVIAKISGDYILIFTPGILFNYMYRVQQKYMNNQNNVIPLIFVCFCAAAVSIGVNYYFIHVLQIGAAGVAIGFLLGNASLCILTFFYIVCSGFYKDTWAGLSKESFHDWGMFTKVAVAGMFMILLEWIGFETGTLLAGYLGQTELATVAILFQIQTTIHIFYICTSIACGVRLGQELGKGDRVAARRVTKVAAIFSVIISTFVAIIIASLSDVLPRIFTSDPAVIKMAAENLLILVGYFFLGGIAISHAGLLRGSGRQQQGAITIFIAFYIFGLPVGIPLMLLTPLRISGYWIGLTLAETIVGISYVTLIYKTNWKRQIEIAQKRAGLVEKAASPRIKTDYSETNVDNDVDENTNLLENSGKTEVYGISKSLTKQAKRPVTCKLLLKRLFTSLAIASLLGISILIKIFVPVPKIMASEPDTTDLNQTDTFSSLTPIYSTTFTP